MNGLLPPPWAIVLGILTLLFGGTTGIVWSLRKERREARAEPQQARERQLENDRKAAEIAGLLRDAQTDAMREMRELLTEARTEAATMRRDLDEARRMVAAQTRQIGECQSETAKLREVLAAQEAEHKEHLARIEVLLKEHSISLPAWWPRRPPRRDRRS